jgi:hypothetical protein
MQDVTTSLESLVTERVVAIGAPAEGDCVDVWAYLAENINEFAVAKSIVDHFSAYPKDLQCASVDALGLYLRAQVTLKREQVSYAIAQRALADAQQRSRSVRGLSKRARAVAKGVCGAVATNPAPAVLAATMALLVWFR